MDTSEIVVGKQGLIAFSGPDATELYAAVVLKSAIGLLEKGIQPTRGYTMKRALAACKRYTGKTYKRGQSEQAKADLTVWIETMKSALPITMKEDLT